MKSLQLNRSRFYDENSMGNQKLSNAFAYILKNGKQSSEGSVQANRQNYSLLDIIQLEEQYNRVKNDKLFSNFHKQQKRKEFFDNIIIQVPFQIVKNPIKETNERKNQIMKQKQNEKGPQRGGKYGECKKGSKIPSKQNSRQNSNSFWFEDDQQYHQLNFRKSNIPPTMNKIKVKQKQLQPLSCIIQIKQDKTIDLHQQGKPLKFSKRKMTLQQDDLKPIQVASVNKQSQQNNLPLKKKKIIKRKNVEQQFKQLQFTIEINQFVQSISFNNKSASEKIKSSQSRRHNNASSQNQQQVNPYQNQNFSDIQIIKTNKAYPWPTGKASLQELVEEVSKKQLIKLQLCKEFIANHTINDIKDFILKFHSGRLHKFDFQKIQFTLLDHRRLSQILINLFPSEYEIGKVCHSDYDINNFLNKLYNMTGEQYFKLFTKIDKISNVKWWSKIITCQEEQLVKRYKEQKVARRKAEMAQRAVQEAINSFRNGNSVGEANQGQNVRRQNQGSKKIKYC